MPRWPNSHGRSKRADGGCACSGIYRVWTNMRARCLSKSHKQYKDYGGRGIKICPEWSSFSVFLDDVGEQPPGMTLDRINNDGDYEKGNVRWAPMRTQNRNKRDTRIISFGGKSMCVSDWADHLGMNRNKFGSRLKRGWCHTKSIITP